MSVKRFEIYIWQGNVKITVKFVAGNYAVTALQNLYEDRVRVKQTAYENK